MNLSTFFTNPLELTPEAFFVIDEDDKFVETNNQFEDFIGIQRSELIGINFFDVIHLQDNSIYETIHKLQKNEALSFENILHMGEHELKVFIKVKMLVKDQKRYYSWMILDYSKELNETQAMIDFIAELHETKSKLVQYNQKIEIFKTVFNQINQGIVIIDSYDRVIFSNSFAQKIFDFNLTTAHAKDIINSFSHIENINKVSLLDHARISSVKDQVMILNNKLEKETRYYLNIFNIDLGEQQRDKASLVWNFFEISDETDMKQLFIDFSAELTDLNRELKEKNDAILILARQDGLTGLYNRKYINDILENEIVEADEANSELSIIIFDIDDFKQFNDNFGHIFGDHVIKTVANLTKKVFLDYGHVGRYGGEEFLIVLPGQNHDFAMSLANKICEMINSKAVIHDGNKASVSVSIGVSSYNPGDTVDSLILRADKALYKAKDDGKNRVISCKEVS